MDSFPRSNDPSDGEKRAVTMGDLGRAIGRYTECDEPDSDYGRAARSALFDIYEAWVDQGRPEHDIGGYERVKGYAAFKDEGGAVAIASGDRALSLAVRYEAEPVFVSGGPDLTSGKGPDHG